MVFISIRLRVSFLRCVMTRPIFDALKRKEHGLSSNPDLFLSFPVRRYDLRHVLAVSCLAGATLLAAPLAAQDDTAKTPPAEQPAEEPAPEAEDEPLRINLSVTVPRGEVNEAQAQQCVDEADAGTISGDIVVCRQLGESGENYFSGSASEARKRYAQETAFKGSPSTPDVSGLSDNGKGISVGGVPPPALMIDVGALPDAPAGSDADRIARGLPPLGQDEELSEEEIRKRREALGLPPPAFGKRKGN
jgi:hypothetical protein